MNGFTRKHLIYGAITFLSLLGAILKLIVSTPGGRAALLFYGLMYLFFLAWAVRELLAISEREREEAHPASGGAAEGFLSAPSRPDEEALASAEIYLDLGEPLETICRYVEPRYADWTPAQRKAYSAGLRAALDQRRSQNAEAAGQPE
jgi:hypothetical protein